MSAIVYEAGFAEGAFGETLPDNPCIQEDHLTKELCEAVAHGATYLHLSLFWLVGVLWLTCKAPYSSPRDIPEEYYYHGLYKSSISAL